MSEWKDAVDAVVRILDLNYSPIKKVVISPEAKEEIKNFGENMFKEHNNNNNNNMCR